MHLVHNEQTKLTATWINTVAAAFIAAGAVAPVAAIFYGLAALPVGPARLTGLVVACVTFGAGIHVTGRVYLRRLRE